MQNYLLAMKPTNTYIGPKYTNTLQLIITFKFKTKYQTFQSIHKFGEILNNSYYLNIVIY